MANPNDEIRDAILRHLYQVHRKAKSPKSAGIGIRDLATELKPAGYKQQQVASNLDYLIQKKWACEVIENRTFTTERGTTQQAEKRTYKISDIGIDHLEAASTYERPDTATKINITNVHGVTVVGDHNVVNTSFTDLSRVLNDMRTAVLNSPKLTDTLKLETVADIDSLQSQLQKPSPIKSVVQALWSGIEKAVTAGGLVELATRAAQLLAPLLL
jgi:hypothetical protein